MLMTSISAQETREVRDLVNAFCQHNGIRPPDVELSPSYGLPRMGGQRDPYGYYVSVTKRVYVFVDLIAEANRRWPSYYGWKRDYTTRGVTAHELGHHWAFGLPGLGREQWRLRLRETGEPELTSYATRNVDEDIAESFQLFVSNPDLLLRLRPRRYATLVDMGLTPLETRAWREVLGSMSDEVELERVAGLVERSIVDGTVVGPSIV